MEFNLKCVFMGSPEWVTAPLSALLNDSNTNIVGVYCQPDKPSGRGRKLTPCPVKSFANEKSLPVYTPSCLDNDAISQLKGLKPDVILVAAYGLILPKDVLNIAKYGAINIHYSLLPSYRGASPVQQSILNGDSHTGITFMQMDEGLDTGPILAQHELAISPTMTTDDLGKELSRLAAEQLPEFFIKLANGNITPKTQDNTQSSYSPKIAKKQAQIDWQKPAAFLERTIRAYQPWPIAYFTDNNQLSYRIWQANVQPCANKAKPGTILNLSLIHI